MVFRSMSGAAHVGAVLAVAAAAMAAVPHPAWASGRGGHSLVFRPLIHGFGARAMNHGGFGPRFGGLPPFAGVIHERPGARPYYTAYGHTETGAAPRPRGVPFARPFAPPTGLYGHLGTGYRPFAGELPGRHAPPDVVRYGRYARPAEARRRFVVVRGGGYGGVMGGAAEPAPSGGYGSPGTYGAPGTYGSPGTYGAPGTYGHPGTEYGRGSGAPGFGFAYRSETPLAARFAEPPLAPSPYAPPDSGDTYAYAAAEDVGPGPRVIRYGNACRPGCACAPRAARPAILPNGIGTAY